MTMPVRAHRASGFERGIALGSVLLLHLAGIWALRPCIIQPLQGAVPAITAIVFSSTPALEAAAENIPINFARPATDSIRPPTIEIASGDNPYDTTPGSLTDLPPRLDPQWANGSSSLPASLRAKAAGIRALIVVVRAFVLETGAVTAAEISASSGFAGVDAFAMAEVKTKWR